MELGRGCRDEDQMGINRFYNGGNPSNSDTLLEIRLPNSRVLRVLSRFLVLAMVISSLPFICILRDLTWSYCFGASAYDLSFKSTDAESMDVLFQDLASQGLIKKGDKAFVSNSGIGSVIDGSRFLNANEIDLVLESDLEQESLLPNSTFDIAFALHFEDPKFVDRIVKVGGIVVTAANNHLSNAFQRQLNYRTVYVRQIHSTIVALKKTGWVSDLVDASAKRWLCQLALEAKKAALNDLEDVLLEPPRRILASSRKYLKKFNYLPDLLGDSLEDYPRRLFVNVGTQQEKNGVMRWFIGNYPTRNQEFELFHVTLLSEGTLGRGTSYVDVPNWLLKNVQEDDFVVMKAEADVVEEMIRGRTIALVDELFLECNNQWHNAKRKKSKRAYWECLALYGRLRDEGVAVHQWWG